ncbi:hypothetical protein BL250_01455 [Erwinia sp. OLTSP20]|uniref:DUF2501 domain-containing protein n=1 Tax=unclassified Erwinia TaxID=2622719 RepID=UPI000C19F18C|nr:MULTISPECIES: DUF2501 domain-containing protein [unclassified Erwinia]PIJ50991.1 hypothetical protein BV501_05655 [Erwinia sp. OAMSP11]PIJ73741.1 hypothetical protein BK416_06445 [Erwinia sp. OLSSP12]PIJ83098.1 hypothetical protein BLD47_05940 [Erwinia sp. OLCASP19]PIJ85696.1 hypothetical protein BLD46_05970 [Erwinia sp. OLMTSP26]PIJ87653.1 hypothetical protein BLD49_05145 [Erwinia sp. OLMDSP33]
MKISKGLVVVFSLSSVLLAGSAAAASWQDQLSNAASSLTSGSGTASGTSAQQGGMSLSSLTGLLNGGNQSLSSNSMTNVAGILQYCVKNNIVDNNADSIKDKLLGKLGLTTDSQATQKQDYKQGLMGLLNTGNNQQINLNSLGQSPLAKKVKTKACDLVLKQGKQFIS